MTVNASLALRRYVQALTPNHNDCATTMPERATDGADRLQSKSAPPKDQLALEYAALEAALRGTPLGRWFLDKHARQNRTPETQFLLNAIAKLEASVLKPKPETGSTTMHASVQAELAEMREAIARTRAEIAAIRAPHPFDQKLTKNADEFDQLTEATGTATSEILTAAENIQEVSWILREKGIAVELCDTLDQRATDIYTACAFQEITGQRTGKMARALQLVEQRVNAIIEGAGGNAWVEHAGQASVAGMTQEDVDQRLMQAQNPTHGEQGPVFERPEPLTLAKLDAIKRAAIFG